MPWTDPDLYSNLEKVLKTFNWSKVEYECQEIIRNIKARREVIDEEFAHGLLALLRGKRQFQLMAQLADAMLQSGLNSSQVRRQYGQALIDQGLLTPAEMVLRSIIQDR